ncbi:uncharacterized protein LOC125376006 [Haliotis rufescens]|uniref:uncharacterized protein LOC125376006 n=1 Tax=Haliotis rufescens TaxID=6454 RepID=UPI00201F7273|nr:uncharacterized protein LOC125376006 [Haliotis rufescens]
MYIEKGDWLSKFDIHSAYHHIDIYPAHTDFLGFAWGEGQNRIFYKFLVLPFGLTTAPYVFTKVTRQLVKYWRFQGHKVVTFLDDGIVSDKTKNCAMSTSGSIKKDLIKSGFVPKVEKSLWEPQQCIEWLGLIIETKSMSLTVPARRLEKVLKMIDRLLDIGVRSKVSVRDIASVIGQIISMKMVTGSVCQLMTRSMSLQTLDVSSWNESIRLNEVSLRQLEFWKSNIHKHSQCVLSETQGVTRVVYSDASASGYGGYCVQYGSQRAQGQWSRDEAEQSSTWRELTAVKCVLHALSRVLTSQRVKWFTDNSNVESIVSKGSMKADLQKIALEIFDLCVSHAIHLEIQWIPRSENQKADYISRIVDYDDWGIATHIFNELERKWGKCDIDRFATHYNCKVVRFCSRFWNPGCEYIDAFTQSWDSVNNWVVPPVYLVSRVLKHMKWSKAKGTLIVPAWYSANYWPLLCPNGIFIPQVWDFCYLPREREAYVPGRCQGGIFGIEHLHFNMLALKMQF